MNNNSAYESIKLSIENMRAIVHRNKERIESTEILLPREEVHTAKQISTLNEFMKDSFESMLKLITRHRECIKNLIKEISSLFEFNSEAIIGLGHSVNRLNAIYKKLIEFLRKNNKLKADDAQKSNKIKICWPSDTVGKNWGFFSAQKRNLRNAP